MVRIFRLYTQVTNAGSKLPGLHHKSEYTLNPIKTLYFVVEYFHIRNLLLCKRVSQYNWPNIFRPSTLQVVNFVSTRTFSTTN